MLPKRSKTAVQSLQPPLRGGGEASSKIQRTWIETRSPGSRRDIPTGGTVACDGETSAAEDDLVRGIRRHAYRHPEPQRPNILATGITTITPKTHLLALASAGNLHAQQFQLSNLPSSFPNTESHNVTIPDRRINMIEDPRWQLPPGDT